jgi:hypothetical protein
VTDVVVLWPQRRGTRRDKSRKLHAWFRIQI